jgi:predicted unusual protein kinase regulating ubiquinone biosynthesis (AarF/ABC1/UbiB family)
MLFKTRYRRILWFFARVLLNLAWWDILLPRLGLRSLSRRTRKERLRRIASSFRSLAIQMGGVMIKVGQFLSSRLDVLPREITDELAGLQDEVQPESFEAIQHVIETEFNAPLAEKFCYFEETPMAAASIGQVHRARLCALNGEALTPPVVVKVQRPNIETIVHIDLDALRVVGNWVQKYRPISKRANVPALLNEFSRSLYEEIDYMTEGKNAETFAVNFASRVDIRVPKVYWSHVTRRVLTLEDVQTIKISDYAALEAAGIDRSEVANRLFDTYLKQIFDDRFFHADPHPGNLFVLPLEKNVGEPGPTPWRLVFIDFGMVGHLAPNIATGLRELFIAVATQDATRIVKAYQTLDVLLPSANISLLERASARVFERFWGKSTTQMMDMHQDEAVAFAEEFSELMYDLPFQIPENLILLGRSLGILSGMCTGLYPEFNIWTRLSPYAAKLVEAEGGSAWRILLDEVGGELRALLSLPRKTEALINKIEHGQIEVRNPELQHQYQGLQKAIRRLTTAIVFAVFMITATQAYLAGQFTLGFSLGGVSFIILIYLLFTH